MDEPAKQLTFDEWLIYVFDRPLPRGGQQEWYWDADKVWWDEMADPA
jgi:hypothetical protein